MTHDPGRGLIRGDHRCTPHLSLDIRALSSKGRGRPLQHIGNCSLADIEPEQSLHHLDEPIVADHLPGTQIEGDGDDIWPKW